MRFFRSSIYLLGGLSALAAADARAQGVGGILPTAQDEPTRQGTRGANFLHLPIGARGNAMGGAVASSVSGPTAWFWNAAGAVTSEGFSIAAGRHQLYGGLDIPQSYAAVSMPVLGGVAGISFNTLSSGQMERTSEANPFGNNLGGADFAWTSTVAGLGYARRLTDRLSAGGMVKYVSEGISDASTSWVAFDLGTQFNTGIYGIQLGGAIQHVGGSARSRGAGVRAQIITTDRTVFREAQTVALQTRDVELPLEFRFSLGVDLLGSAESLLRQAPGAHRLYVEANANDAVDIAPQLGLGAEYSFRNVAFVRAGKHFYNDDRTRGMEGAGTYGLSGGFGLRFPLLGRNARFDYSYTSMADLNNVQAFSIEVGR
jgi:hypothetical protein